MNQRNLAENNLPQPVNPQQPALIDQLFIALGNRNLQEFQRILDQDSLDLSVQDKNGLTPLHLSIRHCKVDFFQAILKSKHDPHIDTRDSEGYTPFIATLGFNFSEGDDMRNKLVQAKANINLPFMPLDAPTGLHKEISAISMAIKGNSMHGAKLLLNAGADVNSSDIDHFPPIIAATNYLQIEMVKLIATKANINISISDEESPKFGYTALMLAVEKFVSSKEQRCFDILKELVDAGSEIDMRSIALAKGNEQILDALIEKEIDNIHVEVTPALKTIFDLFASRVSFLENKEFHLAIEKFDKGHLNLARLFVNSIEDSDSKSEFISRKMAEALSDRSYIKIDALREMGASFYQETPKNDLEKFTNKIAKETNKELSNKISVNTRKEIIEKIYAETASTAASEKIAIKYFLSMLHYTIGYRQIKNTAHAKDKELLLTSEDKAFFAELMEGQLSPSHIETVIFSKLTFDDSLQIFLKNEQLTATTNQPAADSIDLAVDLQSQLGTQTCLTGCVDPDFV